MSSRPFGYIAAIVAAALIAPLSWAEAAPRNVLFILDVSGSMAAEIDGESRMAAAKRSFNQMLANLPPGTRAGVEVYGYKGDKDCSVIDLLTPVDEVDAANIARKVDGLTPRKGATPIAASLEMGADVLSDLEGPKTIVLISDGKENCGGDPVATARRIRENSGIDVRIHVVGFAVDEAETAQLESIAGAGKGRYFAAGSAAELTDSLREVKQQVAEAEPAPAPKGPERVFFDDFQGNALDDAWAIRNQDSSSFLVENSELLLLNTGLGGFGRKNTPNLVVLDRELPDGDWNAHLRFKAEFKTGREQLWFGLRKDAENYLGADFWSNMRGVTSCSDIAISLYKVSGGKETKFHGTVRGGSGCGGSGSKAVYQEVFDRIEEHTATMTLAKRGRSYHAMLDLGETDEDGSPRIYRTKSLTSLRAPGNLAIAVGKWDDDAQGEVLVLVDSVEIEVLPE